LSIGNPEKSKVETTLVLQSSLYGGKLTGNNNPKLDNVKVINTETVDVICIDNRQDVIPNWTL